MANKIYPGLRDASSVEFFIDENQVKAFSGGEYKSFHQLPFSTLVLLREALDQEKKVANILNGWFPNSEMKRLEKFVGCRFGGLDYTPDVKNLELGHGEFWDCPLRGSCKGEGIVCRNLVYKNQIISSREVKLIKLLATSLTNEQLADQLQLPMGTFHVFKKDLYKKLNIQTKQEAVLIAVELNLL